MLYPYLGIHPQIGEGVYLAPSSDVIGDVVIEDHSSVWFQVVIRGDVNTIRIGSRTNIQDGSVLHVTRKVAPLVVGNEVTIGHRVTLHGCTLKDRILVGMGAVILDHALIDCDSIVAAGALVTKGKVFPPRSLIQGSPAKVARQLTDEEVAFLKISAQNYVNDKENYLK